MFTAVQTDKMRKKSSHFRTSSSLNMAVRGGLTRFARPAGSPLTAFVVCPTGCASCRTPVGASHPPGVQYTKKSPYFRTSSSLNMAVRGGLTRFARPAGSPLTAFVVCPTGCASCRTPVGASHPPWSALCEKKLALSYELFFKYGGEGGIRTPDTLPYTHFPGVLLQPLGHLTKLFCRLTSWGQRGATIGSWSKTVKKNFNDNYCLLIL